VVADKTASSTPSCFASRQEAHWSIAAEAADAEEHETKGLDTDALILVPMVLDRMPDAKESDAEP